MSSCQETSCLTIGDFQVHVTRKNIKGLYLRVLPPEGRVVISAPLGCGDEYITRFVLTKQDFVQRAINRIIEKSGSPLEYVDGELLPFLGEHYVLQINEEASKRPNVYLKGNSMILEITNNSSREDRERAIYDYYGERLENELDPLITKWEGIWGVKISGYAFRKQKTIWGSCNRRTRHISFNIELIKYPLGCIEYIVAHELLHILIPGHGSDFKSAMNEKLPIWRDLNARLKKNPVQTGL